MTIGIYSLYWEEQDLIYIGQSQNIENRFKEHLNLLKRCKHTNYKVQNAYNLYGEPSLNIIEECDIIETNAAEIYWTNEFNALNSAQGLCIIEAGQVGWGTNSNSSKYTKIQILKVFSLLYKQSLTVKEISLRTGVSKSTINDVYGGDTHLWLESEYPEKYLIMKNRPKAIHSISIKLNNIPVLQSPIGELFHIKNITHFCSEMYDGSLSVTSMVRGFARVIDGTRKQYKGWKIYNSL